jgi:MFS superfamily sulfate permease-like transporter
MPEAVLATVVFLVGIELIDIKGLKIVYTQRRSEFWIAIITMFIVVLVGVKEGILLAMIISLFDHIRRGYHPKNSLLAKDQQNHWKTFPISSPIQTLPGLMIYRFNHSMYYANTETLSAEIMDLTQHSEPPLQWFCIEMSAVDDVDFTAAETIRSIYRILKKRNIRFILIQILDDVKKESNYDMVNLLGEDAFYETLDDVLNDYKKQHPDKDTPTTIRL